MIYRIVTKEYRRIDGPYRVTFIPQWKYPLLPFWFNFNSYDYFEGSTVQFDLLSQAKEYIDKIKSGADNDWHTIKSQSYGNEENH